MATPVIKISFISENADEALRQTQQMRQAMVDAARAANDLHRAYAQAAGGGSSLQQASAAAARNAQATNGAAQSARAMEQATIRQMNAIAAAERQVMAFTAAVQRSNVGQVEQARLIQGAQAQFQTYSAALQRASGNQLAAATATNAHRAAMQTLRGELSALRMQQATTQVVGFTNAMHALSAATVLGAGPLSGFGARVIAIGSLVSGVGVALAAVVVGVTAFTAAVGVMAVQIAKAGDEAKRLEGRINAITGAGVAVAAEVLRDLRAVSIETGIAIGSTVQTFTRFDIAAQQLGLAREQSTELVEVVQKLGIVGGASTQEISAGLMQLGQGLASGRLQGDELRSVLENMPPFAVALAEALGVTVGELRDLGAAGKLVPMDIFRALPLLAERANEQFGKLPVTVDRAASQASEAWSAFTAELDKSLGISEKVAAVLLGIKGILQDVTDQRSPLQIVEDQIADRQRGLGALRGGPSLGVQGGFDLDAQRAAALASAEAALRGLIEQRDQLIQEAMGDIEFDITRAIQKQGQAADRAKAEVDDYIGKLKELTAIAGMGPIARAEETAARKALEAAEKAFKRPLTDEEQARVRNEAVGAVRSGRRADALDPRDLNDAAEVARIEAAMVGATAAARARAVAEMEKGLELQRAGVTESDTEFAILVQKAGLQAEQNVLIAQSRDLVEQRREMEADVSVLQKQFDIIGMTNGEQAAIIASLEEKNRLELMGVPTNQGIGKVLVENAGTIARQNVLLDQQRNLYAEIRAGADALKLINKERGLLEANPVARAGELAREEKRLEIIREVGSAESERAKDAIAQAGTIAEQNALLDQQRGLVNDIRSLEGDLRMAEKERELIGATTKERAVALALLEKQIELERQGIPLTDKRAQQALDLTRRYAEQREELKFLQGSWEALADAGEQAFDRIGGAITEALATGELDMVEFGNVWKAVVSEMIQTALKLAVLNPIINSVFGQARPTLGGAFGAAGGGGAGGGGLDLVSSISRLAQPGNLGTNLLSGSFGQFIGAPQAAANASAVMGDAGAYLLPGQSGGFGMLESGLNNLSSGAGLVGGIAGNLLAQQIFGGNAVGAGIGSAVGSLAASIALTPVLGPFAPFVGSFLGGGLGGMFGAGPTVGPTGVARLPNVLGDSEIQLTTDNGGSSDAVEQVAKQIRRISDTASEALGAFGSNAFGLDIGGFAEPGKGSKREAGFTIKEILDNVLADKNTFEGLSAEEAVTEGVRLTLQKAFDGFNVPEVATALQNSAAKTIEELLSDLDLANAIGTFAEGGRDALMDLTRPLTAWEQAFRDVSDAAEAGVERARELGLSVNDATAYFAELRAQLEEQTQADFTAQIRELQGRGFLNQIQGLLDARGQNARSAAAAGLDVNATAGQLFNLGAGQILSQLTAAQRALVGQTFGDQQLQDLLSSTAANDNVNAALADFTSGLTASVRAIDAQTSALESQIGAWRNLGDALQQGRIARALNPETSVLSFTDRFAVANQELSRLRGLALGGDQNAIQGFDAAADAALQQAINLFGTNDQRTLDLFNQVQSDSRAIEGLTVSQIDIAQGQLTELQAIRATLEAASGTSQDFGANPVRNRILAGLTNFTGDFGAGAFQQHAANQNFPPELLELISSITSSIGFDTGASFTVGGVPGVDRNLISFKASRGEMVNVSRRDNMADVSAKLDAVVDGLDRIARVVIAGEEMSGAQRQQMLEELAELRERAQRAA